jgi:hypothetical protein
MTKFSIEKSQATPEIVLELAKLLQSGVDTMLSNAEIDGVTPVIGVKHYNPITGEEGTDIHMLATGFTTKLEKANSIKLVAALNYQAHKVPVAVGLVAEAWVSHQAHGENRKYLLPGDDPEREEVVIVGAMGYRTGASKINYHNIRKITRDSNDNISWDGDWSLSEEEAAASNAECNILENFYRAYAAFALGREDPEAYTQGKNVMELKR